MIIAVENKDGNFLLIENKNNPKLMYFNNLIIPIKFINSYQESNVIFPELDESNPHAYNILVDDGIEIAIDNEIKELKWGTKKYLEKIWSKIELDNQKDTAFTVHPYPILWIFSSGYHNHEFKYQNVIYAPYFGVEELLKHLKDSYFITGRFSSVYQWSKHRNDKASYELIDKQVGALIEQIEKDNQLGSLTKKKIQRLNNLWAEDNRIYEKYLSESKMSNIEEDDDSVFDLVFGEAETKKRKLTKLPERIRADKNLDENLVIISGKAGSGKTTEMLLLMKKCYEYAKDSSEDRNIERQRSAYYLTYNKLLAHDVRFITDKYHYGNSQNKIRIKTIHKFFYDLVDNIFLLAFMAHKRTEELLAIQRDRHNKVIEFFRKIELNEFDSDYTLNALGEYFSHEEKEYYLLLRSYIRKRKGESYSYNKFSEIETLSKSFLQKTARLLKIRNVRMFSLEIIMRY